MCRFLNSKQFGAMLAFLLGMLLLMGLDASVLAMQLEDARFYYRLDAETRYTTKRAKWQSEHNEPYSAEVAEELAWNAFVESSLDKPMTRWQAQGGTAPGVMVGKVYLINNSDGGAIEIPLKVTLMARIGPLRVDPTLLLTDTAYMSQKAQWRTVFSQTVMVPAMAPGEEMLFSVVRFEMFRFLRFNPTAWPEKLKLMVALPGQKPTETVLPVDPDHFLLPPDYRF
jgi:hypothetical protein